jgi:hypothetical protein
MTDPTTALGARTHTGLAKVAAVLLPGVGALPCASDVPSFEVCVDRVVAADPRLLHVVRTVGDVAASRDSCTLGEIEEWSDGEVESLVFALTSAYYIAPEVLKALGYPGQVRRPVSEATPEEKYSEEMLAPVRQRGEIFVHTP